MVRDLQIVSMLFTSAQSISYVSVRLVEAVVFFFLKQNKTKKPYVFLGTIQ
jgi:hypothetical protein